MAFGGVVRDDELFCCSLSDGADERHLLVGCGAGGCWRVSHARRPPAIPLLLNTAGPSAPQRL